ncbi:MAG: hypothetical protein V1767_04735, partial [Chloroflexota bacterium]
AESNSKTVDIVVEHELRGVTPEMIDWWWLHSAENYKLWHPKDHVSITREFIPNEKGGAPIRISHVVEAIGEFPATEILLRGDDTRGYPIPTVYGNSRASTWLMSDKKTPFGWLLHDYKTAPYGTKVRSTFRFPAKTPERFLKAMRQHNIEEMGQFTKFLPELYKKSNK